MAASAQYSTSNKYIFATVEPGTGRVHILLPPGRSLDPMLTFPNKSFFSCNINGQLYTNNDLAAYPTSGRGQGYMLQDGKTTRVADTIRTIWKRDNVEIIEDVYPVLIHNGGQILMRWSFLNHQQTPVAVSCQYLNDLDISDPSDHVRPGGQPNGNDGPIILHPLGYYRNWQQYIDGQERGIPKYYMSFLYDLPQAHPGICAYGYLDNPAIGTKRPSRYTIGDWTKMYQLFWGVDVSWGYGTLGQPGQSLIPGQSGGDIAELIEFPQVGAYRNELVVAGATAYGTAKIEFCSGTMFAVLNYPDPIEWDKATKKYTPNPFRVEVLAVNPQQIYNPITGENGLPANNAFFTLTGNDNLLIVDTPTQYTVIGTSSRLPKDPNGFAMAQGNVRILEWYVKALPAYFCQDNILSELKLTGTSSLGDFAFAGDTCGHPIIIGCAESDYDPPIDSVYVVGDFQHKQIDVHDDRPTDRGLKSITWTPSAGTDTTNFIISFGPAVRPCASDRDTHIVYIQQIDSTIGGCYDFTFEDCLAHQSFANVCFPPHPLYIYPDTLPPLIRVIATSGAYQGIECNTRFDSLEILDNRLHDRGLMQIQIKPATTPVNMKLSPNPVPVQKGDLLQRLSVSVIDSMLDGSICIRAIDTAKNITDTCIAYCTIADILKPRIELQRDQTLHLWNVTIREDAAWDRRIDSIYVFGLINGNQPIIPLSRDQQVVYFNVSTIDITAASGFCVYATDLYGNISDTVCVFLDAGIDSMKPNVVLDPDPRTNPTFLTVSINDIHFNDYPINSDTNKWDSGIDSIWFTNNFENKMIVPATIYNHCLKTAPPFELRVRDSLDIDSSACVTINVIDCKGNLTQVDWCYPYPLDLRAPVLFAQYLDKQQIQVIVTDSTTYDRGNQLISTSGEVNLTAHIATVNKIPVDSFILTRPVITESSYGKVTTIDYWGSLQQSRVLAHSADVQIKIWIQDLSMKKGMIVRQAEKIQVPVYFVRNDTIPLASKSITDFSFQYTPTGDVNSLQLLGVGTAGTISSGWNVTATPIGNAILVEGHMPTGGSVLSYLPSTDTLIYLEYQTKSDAATRDVIFEIDQVNNETVIYNLGRDTIYTGRNNATAVMPPPWGALSGAHIVIAGSCAPALNQNVHASRAMLDMPSPNPASRSTVLHYTLPNDGIATIAVYDLLGREVKTVLSGEQKQGYYDMILDVTDLTNGQYVVRLESGGDIQMRTIVVSK